jgi:hypothetical protein
MPNPQSRELVPAPYENAALIGADDNTDIRVTQALYIGATGTLRVTMFGGQVTTFTAVQAGQILPISVTRVWATGTSATGIIGLW